MNGPAWTEEKKARLASLWLKVEDGKYLSHSVIGERMGLSRGQVLGQVRRMQLVRPKLPGQPVKAKPQTPRPALVISTPGRDGSEYFKRKFMLEMPKQSQADAEPEQFGRLRFRQDELCCYPIGTPGTKEFRFCDAPTVRGKPYCPACSAIVYVKLPEHRLEAAHE